jgi:hypothetical protein
MKILNLLTLLVIAFAFAVFASDSALRDTVIAKATGLLGGDDAGALWGIIVAIVGIGGRLILKKIPTIMRGPVGLVFWNVMKGIFGDGVVLSNHSDPEYLKTELSKKYPLLNIDIKAPAVK